MERQEFLTKLENELHSQIDYVVKYLQNMPEEDLLLQVDDKSWSIAQCIDHLNTYGSYYLPLLQRIINDPKSHGAENEIYSPSVLGRFFNKQIKPVLGTKKMNAHSRHLPQSKLSPSLIIGEHIDQQERLLSLLRSAKTVNLSANKIPVSILRFIKLSVGDIFQFLIFHNARHLIQAGNTYNAVKESSMTVYTFN